MLGSRLMSDKQNCSGRGGQAGPPQPHTLITPCWKTEGCQEIIVIMWRTIGKQSLGSGGPLQLPKLFWLHVKWVFSLHLYSDCLGLIHSLNNYLLIHSLNKYLLNCGYYFRSWENGLMVERLFPLRFNFYLKRKREMNQDIYVTE